jgi:phage portal protein BeeE
MGLLQRMAAARAPVEERDITTVEEYAQAVQASMYGYNGGVTQTLNGGPGEKAPNDLQAYAVQAYASNGPVFALMGVRMRAFSAVRFQFQNMRGGRPGDLFGNPTLNLLEKPWPGGTTQDLMIRMIQDADLAGNSYWTAQEDELIRLRPDWVDIVLEPRRFRGGVLGYRKIGYLYSEGGIDGTAVPLLPDEVAHFAPQQDPLATYRGMSWLTPVIRELLNDKLMSRHQAKFFENGATPNMIVKYDASMTPVKFEAYMKLLDKKNTGVDKAYKTMHLAAGADATVVGSDFEQMAFTATQGRGETRLAAAAGVPPVIVGFSEGLSGSSLNEGNFGAARRLLADNTMHPLWMNAAGSMQQILSAPPGARLWYDARDVPFLREDAKDQAEIQDLEARTRRTYLDAGYTADSIKTAMAAGDMNLLQHSGYFSVQLQALGSGAAAPSTDTPPDEGTAP